MEKHAEYKAWTVTWTALHLPGFLGLQAAALLVVRRNFTHRHILIKYTTRTSFITEIFGEYGERWSKTLKTSYQELTSFTF